MTRFPPRTSSNPTDPASIFMSGTSSTISGPSQSPAPTATSVPTATPLPVSDRTVQQKPIDDEPKKSHSTKDKTAFPLPKLRLEIRDLTHPGASRFLSAAQATDVISRSVHNVLRHLYVSPEEPHTHVPPTRSVTFILRDMPGVAHTTGTELDDDHKEIHFSLGYIANLKPHNGQDRAAHEIEGVVTHELVHCYQFNARGTCPGGLIEGIADWVRLNCDLGPPHWKQNGSDPWDRGYEHTAYFLQYLEERFGAGTVRKVNQKLRNQKYEEKPFWTELLGRPVEQLWQDYAQSLKKHSPS